MTDRQAPERQLSDTTQEPPYPSEAYSWYVVLVLMAIYVNSFLDRQILGLFVDPIRKSFDISESQMGFIMGPAFAIFYIIAGIPMGRLADMAARRWIIFIGQMFWSVMSVGCGLVRSFLPFTVLRIGLGVGEASLSPAAYSLITDLFRKHKLARAISVYGMGIYIGAGLARVVGGVAAGIAEGRETWTVPLLNVEVHWWQMVFFFIAAPTIPLSILLLTIKEPVRRGVRKVKNAAGQMVAVQVPIREVLDYLWQNRATMLCHSAGFSLLSFSSYGVGAWLPSHFIRNLGWERDQVAFAYGTVVVFTGASGVLFGGWLADRLRARGVQYSKTLVGLLSAVVWFPFGILYPLMTTGGMALLFFAPAVFVSSMTAGVGPAGIQEIMPNKMRGQASAIYLFIVNLLGLGFGPQIIALFTQYVFGADSAVRWSLLVVPVGAHIIAAVILFFGLKPYRRSLERLQAWEAESPGSS